MCNTAVQLQRSAQQRADDQVRRSPWPRLLDARNRYIDWQEFYLWSRSILGVEERIPDWFGGVLDERCPGFLEGERAPTAKSTKQGPLALPRGLDYWLAILLRTKRGSGLLRSLPLRCDDTRF